MDINAAGQIRINEHVCDSGKEKVGEVRAMHRQRRFKELEHERISWECGLTYIDL